MKKILIICLLMFFGSAVYAQTEKDTVILEYIKNKKDFIALSDTLNLPADIKPYYKCILDYMSRHNMDKNDYYISKSGTQHGWETLTVPIYHYTGFKKVKEMEDKDRERNKNRNEGEPIWITDMNGNASGVDGNLVISRISMQVLSFSIWQ